MINKESPELGVRSSALASRRFQKARSCGCGNISGSKPVFMVNLRTIWRAKAVCSMNELIRDESQHKVFSQLKGGGGVLPVTWTKQILIQKVDIFNRFVRQSLFFKNDRFEKILVSLTQQWKTEDCGKQLKNELTQKWKTKENGQNFKDSSSLYQYKKIQ